MAELGYKEHLKLVSEEPTPLLPEENQKAIRELPRDAETIALFNKLAGPQPLPRRSSRRCALPA